MQDPTVFSTPWSAVTSGDVFGVSVAQDGAVVALARGPSSMLAVSYDATGVERRSRRLGWSASAVALGDDRVLVLETSGVELLEGDTATPVAIPPSRCGYDAKVDGRGFVHVLFVPEAGASVGGEPVVAGQSYIVTVDTHGALRTLDVLEGYGCAELLAVSPAGHRLIRTSGGLFAFAGGVYSRVTAIRDGRIPYNEPQVALADDGSVAIADSVRGLLADGSPSGSVDTRVTLFDPSWRERWTRWVGGPGFDEVTGIARGPDGGVYVAGTAHGLGVAVADPVVDFGPVRASIPPTGSQSFIAGWESDGTLVLAAAPGGARNDEATALALGVNGSLVVGGWFEGAMDLPDGTHMAGATDGARAGYVVALDR